MEVFVPVLLVMVAILPSDDNEDPKSVGSVLELNALTSTFFVVLSAESQMIAYFAIVFS